MNSGTTYESVRIAEGGDWAEPLAVLRSAFAADPFVGWLFPDPATRDDFQTRFYLPLLSHPCAETTLLGTGEAAAIWLSLAPGRPPFEGTDSTGSSEESGFGDNAARLAIAGEYLAERHPTGSAHRYLAVMGVVPGAQGTGLGSLLLRHGLAQADAEGIGSYLEATTAGSRQLYRRYGFADLGGPVHLPGGPTLWPMWREPATTH
ncbi:GNAT family N-acetyltransferase [Saccharomonospora sp. NPDC006951]